MRGRQVGYSLAEMLVAVFLIGLLLALIMPLLSRAKTPASRTICSSQLRQIGIAIAVYEHTYGCSPTAGTLGDPFADTDPMKSLNCLFPSFAGDDPRIFVCPSDPDRPKKIAAVRRLAPAPDGKHLPTGPWLSAATCSYGYDPGHSGETGMMVAIVADAGASGRNSGNHGPNAGQCILNRSGTVEFKYSNVNEMVVIDPPNPKRTDVDPDIFSLSPYLPRAIDSFIRQ